VNRAKEESRDRPLGKEGGETGTVKGFKLHGVTSRKTVPHHTSLSSSYRTSQEISLFWTNAALVTPFSEAEHWILSWSSWIQTHLLLSVSLRLILILSSHIRIVVTLHGLCAQSFPDKRVYKFLILSPALHDASGLCCVLSSRYDQQELLTLKFTPGTVSCT